MLDMIGHGVRPVVASLALAFLLICAGAPSAWAAAAEPAGLWTGPMRGETPATLKGAAVIDLVALEALLPAHPVLLDVGLADRKPEGSPKIGSGYQPIAPFPAQHGFQAAARENSLRNRRMFSCVVWRS